MFRFTRLARFLARVALGVTVTTIALVLPLRWMPPLTTSFMVIAWASGPAGAGWPVQRWVPARAISRQATLAVVASEDQKFFEHHGFDLESIRDALEDGRAGGPSRGASTISQQVAKNLWLWPGHSWLRKGIEAWFTVWLELLWPKERTLEIYLNVAQFGPDVFGVEAAARRYFGKPAAQLSRPEAARLASVLPNPVRFRVARPGSFLMSRQAWIEWQAGEVDAAGLVPAGPWARR
jgi:monofunctional biosynthetic peptidoglycan transglycosylase